jgi:hypothetical protein
VTRLTPKAEQALENLRERHKEYRDRKAVIEAEVRQLLEDRLKVIREERDTAVRLAAEAGVPRTRLGEAIGTSNYKTIQDILASTENQVRKSENGWSLIQTDAYDYTLQVTSFGVGKVTGSADVRISNGEIEYVAGDEFVIPAIYREGIAEEVMASA